MFLWLLIDFCRLVNLLDNRGKFLMRLICVTVCHDSIVDLSNIFDLVRLSIFIFYSIIDSRLFWSSIRSIILVEFHFRNWIRVSIYGIFSILFHHFSFHLFVNFVRLSINRLINRLSFLFFFRLGIRFIRFCLVILFDFFFDFTQWSILDSYFFSRLSIFFWIGIHSTFFDVLFLVTWFDYRLIDDFRFYSIIDCFFFI